MVSCANGTDEDCGVSEYDPLEAARVRLPDGRVGFDAVKLAEIPTEGIELSEYVGWLIVVWTKNTRYTFVNGSDGIHGVAHKENGGYPTFLANQTPVVIHGSTWGGSMIKPGYVGVGMRLEFSIPSESRFGITTTPIERIKVTAINKVAA